MINSYMYVYIYIYLLNLSENTCFFFLVVSLNRDLIGIGHGICIDLSDGSAEDQPQWEDNMIPPALKICRIRL